jgi:hypothetical protein
VLLYDIHGNLPALEAVLADVSGRDVDGSAIADELGGLPEDPRIDATTVRAEDDWRASGQALRDRCGTPSGSAS